MSAFAANIAFVFGLVALGYCAGRSKLLKPATGDALTDFAVTIALPLLLFRTMAKAGFDNGLPLTLWAAYFTAAAVTWIVGELVIVKVFGRDARAGVIGGLASAFSNMLLLGSPLVLGIFGQDGFELLSLIISIHLPVMLAASIVIFALVSREEGASTGPRALAADFFSKLFSNPLVIGILAGLFWRVAGLPLPGLAERFVDTLADVAGPVALFAIGLSLRNFGISGNLKPAICVAAFKLMLMPAIALAVVLLIGLPPLSAKIAVIAAGLPTGVNPYLIASRFGTGQALSSNAMTIGTASAAFTASFWLVVVHWVFG